MSLRFFSKAVSVLLSVMSMVGSAANFSFTGTFTRDDNVQMFNFCINASQNITVRTWSYAGGTNASGAIIPRGGFDPILSVFNSTGVIVGSNDDGGASVAADTNGSRYDTFLTLNALAAGCYQVAVSQFNNFATGPNLSNGFRYTNTPIFTCPNASPTPFECGTRTNAWAFDVLNADSANVGPTLNAVVVPPVGLPVPALSLISLLGLLGALGFVGYRRVRR